MYRKIKDMIWPAPCREMQDLEWKFRYEDDLSKTDRNLAASIIAAYLQMISDTQKKRNFIISELRQGPNLPFKGKIVAERGEIYEKRIKQS